MREVRKVGLQAALEDDIKEKGFRNPIVIYALPEGNCLGFGGSRLRVAIELEIPIPCIINDYTGQFSTNPEVTPCNWPSFFTDIPCWHEFGEFGFDCHYGLERMRREEWGNQSTGLDWLEGKRPRWLSTEMPWTKDWLDK
jgi:hypothetical protein